MRKALRATPVAVILSMVAACAASPAAPPTTDATQIPPVAATPTPDATSEPTPMPSPAACTPGPSSTAVPGEPSSAPGTVETPLTAAGPLEPGRYTTTQFEPRIALTLGSGWNLLFADDNDELAFDRSGMFLGFGRVTRVIDPATGRDEDAPSDLVSWLAQHEALTDTCTRQATVGGIPGTMVEGTAARTTDLFSYPTGNFRIVAANRFRWYVLTVDGQELTITVAAPAPQFDALITETDAVLDSVEVFPQGQ